MATEARIFSDLPVPPGELLTETLEALDLSQAELARRMDRPVQAINEIARGTKEITPETAIQLERVLGVPAHVWLGLETEYQHTKARLQDRKRLEIEAAFTANFPCDAMAQLGWIPKTRDLVERAGHLLSFFGVGSLRVVREAEAAAFRISRTREAQSEALAAWLRKGALEAQTVDTKPFREERLRSILPELRRLTTKSPAVFEPGVREALASAGVALVLLPHLPKTHANGAARWLSPEKALIQLTLRGKWADIFWFTLFHEVGHLLLHGRRDVFIELEEQDKDAREREADKFAGDVLIPPEEFKAFVRRHPRVSGADVSAFARSQGISDGIVVGRLQFERVIRYADLNGLRTRLEWAER
jgi:HTH-type transcriptional regulator/antitoxin HigA